MLFSPIVQNAAAWLVQSTASVGEIDESALGQCDEAVSF